MLICIINHITHSNFPYNLWIKIEELALLFAQMDILLLAEFVHLANHLAIPVEVQQLSVLIVYKIKI